MRSERLLWLAILLLAWSHAAEAVEVPPWLSRAASLSLPSYPPETNAVVLLDTQTTSVSAKGAISTSCRRALKVLRQDGCAEACRLVLGSAYDTKISSMTGWRLTPGRQPVEVGMKKAIESGLAPDTLYTDVRVKMLLIPEVEVGSVVGFEWEQQRTPPSLEDIFEFQRRFPVLRAVYSVTLPPGWSIESHWVNWNPEEAKTVEKPFLSQTWEVQNVPALIDEPFMPEDRALAGRVIVRFKAPEPDSRCFAGWADMGSWYDRLSMECRLPGAEISAKARELAAQAPDTLSKLRSLAGFVQKEIRYVSVQIGIGGFKPHQASSIFFNRYGDCKDKATLLSSMLRALGITSYYLIVNTDRGAVMSESPVSLYSFNHAVLGIRLTDDIPDTGLAALVRHPKLGRLLIFDPTYPYTPLGHLPVYLQGNTALLVAEDSGELLSLPLPEPENNLLERQGRFTLRADGTLEGEVEETRRGYVADELRRSIQASAAPERTRYFETFLANFFAGFSLQTSEVKNLEENHRDLVASYRFSVPKYAKTMGDLLIVRPRVLGKKTVALETSEKKPRLYPVNLLSTSLQRDEFAIELPEGYKLEELPPQVDLNPGFAIYQSKTEISGRTMVYRREYRLLQPDLSASRFEEAVKFFRAVDTDERQSALLKKQNP